MTADNPFARRPGFGAVATEIVPGDHVLPLPGTRPVYPPTYDDHAPPNDWRSYAGPDPRVDRHGHPLPPPEVRDARASGESAAKRAEIRAIGATLEAPPAPRTPVLPDTKSPADLSAALAMVALRKLETLMDDRDYRVALEAQRTVVTIAPRMVEMAAPPAPEADPAAKAAALRAALATPDVIALVVETADEPGPLRDALCGAGWLPAGDSS